MNKRLSGGLAILFIAIASGRPLHAASSLHIVKMAVGTAIDSRNLEGEAQTFDASVPRLYCWTQVTADTVPATLKHVWSLDGKSVAEVSLPITYATMRTWSSKTPAPGNWKVDAVDETGAVLSSVSFTVTPSTATAAK